MTILSAGGILIIPFSAEGIFWICGRLTNAVYVPILFVTKGEPDKRAEIRIFSVTLVPDLGNASVGSIASCIFAPK